MIHIALTIDQKFVKFCAVTMASIVKNNKPNSIAFHIIGQDLSEDDKQTIKTSLSKDRSASVNFYSISDESINGYEVKWGKKRLSKIVFCRCILPSILPQSVEKVLYLDCDIIVLGELDDLWNTDLTNMAVAGVQDAIINRPNYYTRLKYEESYNYVNGGVLLINLDYWRKNNIEEECLKYFHKYPERIIFNDQDIINGLLYDKKVLLDFKWNVQEDLYRLKNYRLVKSDPKCLNAMNNPIVLHYSGRKPWQYHAMHPLRYLFFEYQKLANIKEENGYKKELALLHRFFHLLPYYLKLKKQKYIDVEQIEIANHK